MITSAPDSGTRVVSIDLSLNSTGIAAIDGPNVAKLRAEGYPVVEVPPSNLKRYATGKGNSPKDQVLAAVINGYPKPT